MNGSTLVDSKDNPFYGRNLTDPSYYDLSYKLVCSCLVTTIFVVGILGNLMVVFVVKGTRNMRTTTNCYLVSLSVADIILLVSAPLPTIVENFLMTDQSAFAYFGTAGCSIMVFCQYLGINVSSLSIMAFTMERHIAICHPMRAHTMCTIRRAKKIIAALWVFGVVYCVPWLGLTTIRPRYFTHGRVAYQCNFKLERSHYLTYFMADLVIFYVIPLVLTCVLYGLIAARLYRSSKFANSTGTVGGGAGFKDNTRRTYLRQLEDSSEGKTGERDGSKIKLTSSRYGVNFTSNSGNGMRIRTSTANSRVQVTKMLAVVVCVFAILWLPYRVYVVYNSFASKRFESIWFLLVCRLMVYMNSAINPILYSVMSVKFRKAFLRLLSCNNRSDRASDVNLFSTQVIHCPARDLTAEL